MLESVGDTTLTARGLKRRAFFESSLSDEESEDEESEDDESEDEESEDEESEDSFKRRLVEVSPGNGAFPSSSFRSSDTART